MPSREDIHQAYLQDEEAVVALFEQRTQEILTDLYDHSPAEAKGIRKGYLSAKYLEVAQRGYDGIIEHLVDVDEQGQVNLIRICQVAGLGGEQKADGSFENHLGEPIVTNDLEEVGAFILASVEIEMLNKPTYTQSACGNP